MPEVLISSESVPPTINDKALTGRLRQTWTREMGEDILYDYNRVSMGAEDFPFFTIDPYIPSTYFRVEERRPKTSSEPRAVSIGFLPTTHHCSRSPRNPQLQWVWKRL